MVDFNAGWSAASPTGIWCTICDSSLCTCNDILIDAPIPRYEDEEDQLERLEETEEHGNAWASFFRKLDDEPKPASPASVVSKFIEEIIIEEEPSKIKTREEGESRKPYERFREKQYICDLCDQSFTLKQNVQQHIIAFHGLDCTEFDKDFAERRRKRFKCTKCAKVFLCLEAAQRHEEKNHKPPVKIEKTTHKCDYCEKIYPNKTQLSEHVSIVHLNERNYVCDVCGTSFGRRGGLRRHIKMVHMGETFSCPYEGCDHPGYKCSKALAAHVRSVHTGERPFSCLMCDRSFVRRNDLKVHERTHDLVEEQTCQRCGSVFKREHYLKKHARTCNGIAPPLQVAKQRRAECNKKAPKKKVVVVPQAARRIMPDRSTKRRRE